MEEFKISPNGKYTESEWKLLIKNFNPDIETKTKYCLRFNTSRNKFAYWYNKIFNKSIIPKKNTSDFKEVILKPNNSPLKSSSKEFINVTYPSGIKVDIPAEIDSLKLAQLIINIQKVI